VKKFDIMSPLPHPLQSKLPQTGTTIFAVMSRMAKEQQALNLSQGFPDFPVSQPLIDRVHFYMQKGYNQYAPLEGIEPLREAVCSKAADLYGSDFHPEREVNVTAGATQAIYTAIASVVQEKDEVILFSPAYDSYAPAVEIHGGVPVYSCLRPPDYSIDWEEVKTLISPRTRMIVINTPHNPTGTVLNETDMKTLDKITRGTDIIVLSDEVYEHIIFNGKTHWSALRFPNLRERSFVIFSFGKMFHCTGWKIGYCLAPEFLMKEFRSIHQFLVYCCNTPVQFALADFLQDPENYLHIAEMYQQKRDIFLNKLQDSRFRIRPASGSYFQLLDYSRITDENDMDFAARLTREHKIASIPVSVFYPDKRDEKVLRFCFAKQEETLEKASDILCRI
jgi:methionine transaminase